MNVDVGTIPGLEGLDPQFAASIAALIQASGGTIWINSGFRSHERQQQLWDEALAKYGDPEEADNWVARPGGSRHEFGMAVDLGGDTDLAHQLAPQFGLVFPMDHEPWHIEPYGARSGKTSPHTDPYGQGQPAQEDIMKRPDVQMFVMGQLLMGQDPTQVQAMVAATFGVGGGATQEGGASTAQTGSPASGQTASIQEIASALRGAGFEGDALAMMTAIALRESAGRSDARGDTDKTGGQWGPSIGWFQIRTLDNERGTGGWRDEEALMADTAFQAQAAWEISGHGTNFEPWSVYNSGTYLEHLDEVKQALGMS
jgi:hypothetical protein